MCESLKLPCASRATLLHCSLSRYMHQLHQFLPSFLPTALLKNKLNFPLHGDQFPHYMRMPFIVLEPFPVSTQQSTRGIVRLRCH